ncbi:hypothetical protein [Campylobacter sp. CCS1377]|uniref:Uncharacterized protein n=1 Tax=Campylobacter sp. CCS1377 TaxID=3158229 RepID=A0AAU7E8E3_9BACT|nr:hypothetical protein [Campylobacter jejuni]
MNAITNDNERRVSSLILDNNLYTTNAINAVNIKLGIKYTRSSKNPIKLAMQARATSNIKLSIIFFIVFPFLII